MSIKNLMLFALTVLLVTGVVLTGGCAPAQETPTRIIENVTPQEAFTLIQENHNNPEFVILDVRTPEEFAEGHIGNAINIDYSSGTFRDKLNKLDKNKTYLVYCATGSPGCGSIGTSDIMAELNFREVYNMLGGIISWKTAGLPTTK